jgi:hypothetical protein
MSRLDIKHFPSIVNKIEENKKLIIHGLLDTIKTSQSAFYAGGWGPYYILKKIQYLHEIGIDWPELDIIEKSVNHESLNESAVFKNKARYGDWSTTDESLFIEVDNFVDIIGEDGTTTLELLDSMLNVGEFHNGTDSIDVKDSLRNLSPLKLPNIASKLEPYKTSFIRLLLKNIKNMDSSSAPKLLTVATVLRKFGVRWPELPIIMRSVQFDIDNPRIPTEVPDAD